MTGHQQKSKKRLGGKRSKPPKSFQVYLDENLQKCKPVLEVMASKGITVHQHFKYFPKPGEPDSKWLPLVGKRNWALITADDRFRYNDLERIALIKYRLKVFSFMNNNMGGNAMAAALDKAMKKISNIFVSQRPPFVCSITELGNVSIRWKPRRSEIRAAKRMQGI